MAAGLNAMTCPLVWSRQQKSTSSPALRYSVSNPPTRLERPAVERHVAPGDVLRHHVGEQHVARPAGSRRDGGLHPIDRRRRDIRSADPRVIAGDAACRSGKRASPDRPCNRSPCRRRPRPWPPRAPALRAKLRPMFRWTIGMKSGSARPRRRLSRRGPPGIF